MKKTLALAVAGALAAGAALVASPPPANAQVGVSVGFGSGYGWGYDPGWVGVGFGAPVGYYDAWPDYYEAPAYTVVRQPARRVVVSYVQPDSYYAPRRVVRTRVVTRAPRYVTREVVTTAPAFRQTRVIRRTYY